MKAYRDFLAAKAVLADQRGVDVDLADVHPALYPHQRDLACWAVRGGRRGIFAAFGLGKTLIQLEVLRLTMLHRDAPRGLIVAPLGVRQEFRHDAQILGVEITFIRTTAEASAPGIFVTNYESVRDGKVDPRVFDVVSLDEAGILRGFGGTKTFREFMRLFEGSGSYRFVATATPSPNDYIELLAYAAFLDVMDVGQAKTRIPAPGSPAAGWAVAAPGPTASSPGRPRPARSAAAAGTTTGRATWRTRAVPLLPPKFWRMNSRSPPPPTASRR